MALPGDVVGSRKDRAAGSRSFADGKVAPVTVDLSSPTSVPVCGSVCGRCGGVAGFGDQSASQTGVRLPRGSSFCSVPCTVKPPGDLCVDSAGRDALAMELERCRSELELQKESFRGVDVVVVSFTAETQDLRVRNDALAREAAVAQDLLAQTDGVQAELELERGVVRELGRRVAELVEERDEATRELAVAADELRDALASTGELEKDRAAVRDLLAQIAKLQEELLLERDVVRELRRSVSDLTGDHDRATAGLLDAQRCRSEDLARIEELQKERCADFGVLGKLEAVCQATLKSAARARQQMEEERRCESPDLCLQL
ncbi:hypothetical protein ACQ4PT_049884 [Festuca glaucescens]